MSTTRLRPDTDEETLPATVQPQSSVPGRASQFRPVRALLSEAVAATMAAPVASVITVVMIAGMCAAVVLTAGRTVGAEQAVVGSIDSAGTRSIIIRAEPAAGLDTSVLDRMAELDGIEWTGAFGPATDVQNAGFPGGTQVPLRLGWAGDWSALGLPDPLPGTGGGDVAYGSAPTLEQLGIDGRSGSIATTEGRGYTVTGPIGVPDYLGFLQPLLVAPQPDRGAPQPVSLLVVIAARPDLVAPVSAAVGSVLAVDDPTKVSIQTSEDLAKLRALIEGQLGAFGSGLTLGIFVLTALVAGAILYGIVMLRRKDFGRRRALGASQRLIVALLLVQTALLAAVGAVIGTFVGVGVLIASGDPSPGVAYLAAVATVAVAVGAISSLVPAIVAARREPIKELRVP